ncbi:sulfotransferase family protein [Rhodoblastus acidophilus]|uniref:Sulfotransferase family protein n=1 Tax=Candidatus Rhodoblastus alkanivorans TaxID=2954117 RepID=A0ABS9Z8Z8_9HYPH|nr:sulfotransferase family 2 domain-containing protein [Candidatus Rhodoblastus alkanivorans]MCI4679471.1 sulfotransferase family protein [Candidatus Rhodoblastus alkanivorans]MCI4683916.1 sulfotransferase family protein [Candidatus Rhodoblastus alkanivorans]MDI4641235.1 sulfotransferase family protein [Rhodoblastus acidophilus]
MEMEIEKNGAEPGEDAPSNEPEAGPGFTITEFDEAWYLSKHPDVKSAVAMPRGLHYGRVHYLKHGKQEQREAHYTSARRQLLHLHIPKTAGSSLRAAFARQKYNVFSIDPNFKYDPAEHSAVDVFSGHVGFRAMTEDKGGRLRAVTILRDPVDRILSYYYHLIKLHDAGLEVSERTTLAKKYPLDDFLSIKDHPHLLTDMFNAVTWQLLHGVDISERIAYRRANPPLSDADLVNRATKNLASCLVVGFQDRMPEFLDDLTAACGVRLTLGQDNSNDNRTPVEQISTKTRDNVLSWVHLDVAVYRWARSILIKDACR